MGINLKKSQSINLTKEAPGINNIYLGLGWDEGGGSDIDCDVSIFMLNADNKIPSEGHFVFFNNLTSSDGSIQHQGDNRTGEGDGDDEAVFIDLSRVDDAVLQILVVVTIHDAESKGQDFGVLENAFIRVVNQDGNVDLCNYDLQADFDGMDSVQIARLYRDGSSWSFEAMAQGFSGGLETLLGMYQG